VWNAIGVLGTKVTEKSTYVIRIENFKCITNNNYNIVTLPYFKLEFKGKNQERTVSNHGKIILFRIVVLYVE
jgi:hypothetical protein